MIRLTLCLLMAAALGACSTPSALDAGRAADVAAAQALAAAAPPEDEAFAPWLTAERTRIQAERAAAGERFQSAEKACWQRFVVNACLREARVQRRVKLDRLRQEDLALNEVERQRLTATRMQQLEQKKQDAAGGK